MIRFIAANGLAVCSTSTIEKRLESTRSVFCTIRRFFSLPHCEKEGDNTQVIGWAGLNHLQRAQAIAGWYLERKEQEGWDAERLKPMRVALDELVPWLKQWYDTIDPEYGKRLGDYYEGFLLEELRQLELSRDELPAWEPPAPRRGGRRRRGA